MNNAEFLEGSSDYAPEAERRDHLLADLALQGLSEQELLDLDGLGASAEVRQDWRLAAAAALVALEADPTPELPHALRLRVLADADNFFGHEQTGALRTARRHPQIVPWLGWIAAAACLVVIVYSRSRPTLPAAPSLEQRLARIAPLPFVATEHPLAAGAGGDVVWSKERQEGFLVIRGLGEVEPSRGVYQLWIFDDSRDPRFPIDGGTFTIRDASASTHVPIRAGLPVREPTLFAVTLEPPGGVVVSDRKRLLLTASVAR
jgi:hypothetical protein